MTTLTKTTRDGREITVDLIEKIGGKGFFAVTLAGATVGERCVLVRFPRSPAPGITHYLTSEPPVAFTADEAATLERVVANTHGTALTHSPSFKDLYRPQSADDRYEDGIDDPRYWARKR